MAECRRLSRALLESGQHCLDHLRQRQPQTCVQLGREPHFRVHDTIQRMVECTFGRHPLNRVDRLHHTERVLEGLEVLHERSGVRTAMEPVGEFRDVSCRQLMIDRGCEFDDRLRTQAAIEMIMQDGLWRLPDLLGGRGYLEIHSASRCTLSGVNAGMQIARYSAPSGPTP